MLCLFSSSYQIFARAHSYKSQLFCSWCNFFINKFMVDDLPTPVINFSRMAVCDHSVRLFHLLDEHWDSNFHSLWCIININPVFRTSQNSQKKNIAHIILVLPPRRGLGAMCILCVIFLRVVRGYYFN